MDLESGITPWDLECMLRDQADPKALPLSLLEKITDDFSDEQEIGRGGFAVVYKGKLVNRIVAVKRMSNAYMHEKAFQREVACLMMVKHENIVRFLGYCADTQGTMARLEGKFIMADVQQRLLCFEYLPNGSLDQYITGRIMWHTVFLSRIRVSETITSFILSPL
jgi:serine/threonine protein kinase